MPLEAKVTTDLEDEKNRKKLCEQIRQWRQDDLDQDSRNRDRGIDDSRYAAGYQWPLEDYRWRKANNIPAMTFNMVPSLLRHRLGARARKRVGPKIDPINVGERYAGIAEIREGLIRNIERNSGMATIDAIVSQSQLISGIGNYEIAIEYANNDVFDTDIRIKTDQNPWSYIWDGLSTDPTGRDARRVIKETVMSRKDFIKKYPKSTVASIGENPINMTTYPLTTKVGTEGLMAEWINEDTVRVALVWTMHTKERDIVLLTNGDVVPLPNGVAASEYEVPDGAGGFHTVVVSKETGMPMVRRSPVKFARGVLTNGIELLADPYEIEIDRVPIVRVPGWLIQAGEKLERYGMISFAKDALTFYNYVKSDRIERIVYRNRAQYEAQEEALSPEQELQYRNAHKLRGGVLKYRGPKPEQVEAPVVDQAAIIETQAAQESIYDIFDIRPGLAGQQGMTPPSGISLEQQMNITDTGGIIYDEMMIEAKKEVYRVINQMIPVVYDAPRIEKIVGSDGRIKDAILNDPENPESVDVTLGKYAVDASVGPSADTQRAQAIEFYQTMFNANPELMGLVAPELIELLNIPGTEKLVDALRERSGVVDKDNPEAQAAAAKQAELEQKMQDMQIELQQLQIEKVRADAQAKMADAEAKMAMAESERAQAEERRAKMEADTEASMSKVAEMMERVNLIVAQTEKVMAETRKIESEPAQTGDE